MEYVRKDGTVAVSQGPAKGAGRPIPKHPDFAEGNKVSVKHGLFSDALNRASAEDAYGVLVERFGLTWIEQQDQAAVGQLCRTEAMAARAFAAIANYERIEDAPQRLTQLWQAAEGRAQSAAKALGLTPESRATMFEKAAWMHRLANDSVASLAATGRAIRNRRD